MISNYHTMEFFSLQINWKANGNRTTWSDFPSDGLDLRGKKKLGLKEWNKLKKAKLHASTSDMCNRYSEGLKRCCVFDQVGNSTILGQPLLIMAIKISKTKTLAERFVEWSLP